MPYQMIPDSEEDEQPRSTDGYQSNTEEAWKSKQINF